ncbi:MAG: ATP-binding cassette domain-containing protein [Proteobacteria bacterium]|nr:ATP-binding cassette domain-containing protein [Pseudomonadota bacterium]
MSSSHTLLKVAGLSKRFGGLLAVDSVDFEIQARRITALIGPNGAGKTTVFNCLTGFYRPSGGSITAYYEDRKIDLARLAPHQIAHRAGLARTFQNIRLFRRLSVLENLLAAQHRALMQASGFTLAGLLGLPRWQKAERAAIEKARFWLSQLGILPHANDAAGSLPYGVQRRVEIARALCMEPQLLCLDEPAAGLNPKESAGLAQFLQKLRDEHQRSVLLIEHDMSVVMGISDHVIVLDHGQKIAEGTAEDVRNSPEVIKAYLGEDDDA